MKGMVEVLNEQLDINSWFYHDKPHLEEGDELEVRPEPENEYDEDAIALYKGSRKVGFIPKEITWKVHEAMKSGSVIEATVVWPYQEELEMVPRVELTDAEERMRRRAERERTEKRPMGDGAKIAIYAAVIVVLIAIILASVGSLMS